MQVRGLHVWFSRASGSAVSVKLFFDWSRLLVYLVQCGLLKIIFDRIFCRLPSVPLSFSRKVKLVKINDR